ncbi:hypothetical protein BLJAPNOD_02538 [Ensifer sp. M14]|uniref:DUF4274 domain-containing protein n=1 Tax=Ensifer sp. M14 TaxID=2203782 RepID=UPI000E1C5877|nr:DUF4274 domain-containing protein [Ensifer sp. M14]RDL51405.1 hypothetical protein BLJAPNOD_02538 [Ensifer sp. M14]
MRVETLFWIVVVVLSCLFLLYRHVNRRRLNRALGKLPEIYDAARASFLSGSRARGHGILPLDAMLGTLEAFSEAKGGGPPPEFADLTKREMRFFELLHATTSMSDREFKRTLARLSKQEQKTFQELRDLYGGPALGKSYPRARIDRMAAKWRSRRETKLAAEHQRVEDEYWSRFDQLQIYHVPEWLKTEAPRDPDMWHKLVGLNWDYSEIYDILLWVVSQPECDASTAILILQMMAPDVAMELASGGTQWLPSGGIADQIVSSEVGLLAMIGKRSEEESFVRHELLPDRPSSEEGNAALLGMMLDEKQRIEGEGRTLPFPLPVKLLSKPHPPMGRKPKTDYNVHDGCVLLPKSRP